MATGNRFGNWLDDHGTVVILIVPLAIWAVIVSQIGGTVLQRVTIGLFINLGLTLALQVFSGNSGVLSFGQYGYVAVGAYMSAVFTLGAQKKMIAIPELYPFLANINLPSFLPAMLLAAAIATVIAIIIMWPIMRLSGAAATISTFALLIVFHFMLINWEEVTNGTRAIFGIPRYTTVLNVTAYGLAALAVAYWFKETPLGLKLRSSREDSLAAQSIGIDIVRARYIAFVLSALLSAMAGAYWGHFILTFTPTQFWLPQTFLIVAMLIVGGSGSISGAVVGTVAITIILEGLRAVENTINLAGITPWPLRGIPIVTLSFALVFLLIYRPQGLTGGYEIRWRHIRSLFGRSADVDQSALAPADQEA